MPFTFAGLPEEPKRASRYDYVSQAEGNALWKPRGRYKSIGKPLQPDLLWRQDNILGGAKASTDFPRRNGYFRREVLEGMQADWHEAPVGENGTQIHDEPGAQQPERTIRLV